MSTTPLDPAGPVASTVSDPGLTLLRGTTFCLSERGGDIAGGVQGFFGRDTRLLSRLRVEVDGRAPEALTVLRTSPETAVVLARIHPPPGRHDSIALLERSRQVADTLSETLQIRNYGPDPLRAELRLLIEVDFADLFAVKDGLASQVATRVTPHQVDDRSGVDRDGLAPVLAFGAATPDHGGDSHSHGAPGLVVAASGQPDPAGGALVWQVCVAPRGTWSATVQFRAAFAPDCDGDGDGDGGDAIRTGDRPFALRAAAADDAPTAAISSTAAPVHDVLLRSVTDLRSLQVQLPTATMPALAAGAPWFMTLFGRDSLLAGYMALPWRPELLGGALQTLAALQGRRTDPATEEQPGRIMHELRLGRDSARAIGGRCYYGTADATPLFAMMVAEAWRWGLDQALIDALLPAVDAALAWCRDAGDSDGDGFVDYERMNPRGLANQGWKDSFDGISTAAGAMPSYPVALCEVQAYRFRALEGRARIAEHAGDPALAAGLRAEAASVRDAFRARFWLPEAGRPALGLDGSGRPLDALASNAAHCLWGGLLDDDEAERVIAALAGPDMDSGWGLRTLSTSMGAYNPMSYHNGSVWPHDTAIAVAGLAAHRRIPGALDLAHRLTRGLLDAAAAFEGRLPELLCGFAREQYPTPVPYPTSCSPQAWSSAAPLLLLRALLGLDPDVPGRAVRLDPALPPEWGTVEIAGLALGPATVTVTAAGTAGSVRELPHGWDACDSSLPVRTAPGPPSPPSPPSRPSGERP